MKKYLKRIINILKFAWNYLIYQDKKRQIEKIEKEILQDIPFDQLSSRQKERLKANKEKIRSGQPSSYQGMIRGFRKKRYQAKARGSKLYLGKKNKYGLRDILNGQEDAADRCEVIVDPNNVKQLNVTKILKSLIPA